jgi:hypothetical protein
MADTNRPSKARPAAGRISLATMLAVLLISSAAPAQAAPRGSKGRPWVCV